MFHRGFVPIGLAEHPPFQSRRHDVVTVLENIGLHHHVLPDDALDRVPAATDERLQILDDGGGELTRHRSINRNPRGAKEQIARRRLTIAAGPRRITAGDQMAK